MRSLGKTLDACKRAKPVLLVVVNEVADGALGVDLHFADGIDCVLARGAGKHHFKQFHGLGQVPEGNLSPGLDFVFKYICSAKGLGNAFRAQNLPARCLRGYAGGDIDRRTKVAIAAKQRRAMMQSGADYGEILAIGDGTIERRQGVHCNDRIRKNKERTISDQGLQMPQWFHRRSNQIGEVIHQVRGGVFAVSIRKGRIPRNVDEAESRLDGCAVVQASTMVVSDVCQFIRGRLRQPSANAP